MKPYRWLTALGLVAALGIAVPSAAQERGRTDGPEGSEYGKGGYSDSSSGRVSLQLDWGGAFQTADGEPPLFFGATGSYWMDDWFVVDGSFAYLLNNDNLNFLVGPRFRTPGLYPLAFSLGLKAGLILVGGDEARFGLSPQVGADFMMTDKVLLGLSYAADFAVGEGGSHPSHRVFMNIGYRF